MIINPPDKFTAREYEEIKISQDEAEKNRQFQLQLAKIEHSWNQLFRLPLALIALPVRFVQAIALCVLEKSAVLGPSRQLTPQVSMAFCLWISS